MSHDLLVQVAYCLFIGAEISRHLKTKKNAQRLVDQDRWYQNMKLYFIQ